MKRGRKSQPAVDIEQPIGHLSVPIEDHDLQRVQTILKPHAVELRKMSTPDNWWLLLFPKGTMKIKKETQGTVTTSTIRLADGFSFPFEEASFNHDKTYATLPRLLIGKESLDVQS